MKTKLIQSVVIFSIFFYGCDPSRKITRDKKKKDDLVTLNFDTLTIKPGPPEVYSPAATQFNDILHTSLNVRFDWEKRYLYGQATISIRPYFYPVKTLKLDARGMELKEVALVGTVTVPAGGNTTQPISDGIIEAGLKPAIGHIPLKYEYKDNVITIELGREYNRTETYTIFIDYISKPDELVTGGSAAITSDKGLYFINPDGKDSLKPKQIWTQGETQASSVWFPTNDRTNEKMTEDIRMTVEDKYVTLSNGVLASSVKNGDGTRTDHWRMDLPHAPYLVMMAVGEFDIVKDKWRDKEVSYYVNKDFGKNARNVFGRTPEMMEFFSKKLGVDYPWAKYSQICVYDYVSGAMENTSATLHGQNMLQTPREMLDGDYEDYISHELFHQWFGDLVTCESWSNLPLNESFATYAEDLWEAHAHGSEAEEFHSYGSRQKYFREALSEKQVPLIRYYLADKEDMFDSHSYDKGGQVLRMLHWYVGDDAFFASLKLYLETNKYKAVEIDHLRLAFEQVTGEDLHWFFNQWFFSPGHPAIEIKNSYDETKKQAVLTLKQTQEAKNGIPEVFRLPLDVDVFVNGKAERKRIVMEKREQEFRFDVAAAPDLVLTDAPRRVLMMRAETKTAETWAYQYKNATTLMDRLNALYNLSENKDPEKAALRKEILVLALDDPFWYVRSQAILRLDGDIKDQKEKVAGMMLRDPKASVRNTAVYSLAEKVNDASLTDYYKKALNDSSYQVLASALEAITKQNPEAGIKLAAQYEKEANTTVIGALCSLYGAAGSDANYAYMRSASQKVGNYEMYYYLRSYGQFLTRCSDETVIKGLEQYDILLEKRKSDYFRSAVAGSLEIVRKHYETLGLEYQTRITDLKSTNANATGIPALEEKQKKAFEMQTLLAAKKAAVVKK